MINVHYPAFNFEKMLLMLPWIWNNKISFRKFCIMVFLSWQNLILLILNYQSYQWEVMISQHVPWHLSVTLKFAITLHLLHTYTFAVQSYTDNPTGETLARKREILSILLATHILSWESASTIPYWLVDWPW